MKTTTHTDINDLIDLCCLAGTAAEHWATLKAAKAGDADALAQCEAIEAGAQAALEAMAARDAAADARRASVASTSPCRSRDEDMARDAREDRGQA